MAAADPPIGEQVRGAELVATLCLATDLGMGFPLEHGLRTTLIATRLAERLGVDATVASQTYYATLLAHAGCTTDVHVLPRIFGDLLVTHFNPVMYGSAREAFGGLLGALPDPGRSAPVRAAQVAARLPRMVREQRPHLTAACEVAAMLASGLGVPAAVAGLLALATDRWDGKGPLRRAKGDEIPMAMRIAHVAIDASFQRMLGGPQRSARVVGERAGGAFDPEVAGCLQQDADEILAFEEHASVWEDVLAAEPATPLLLEGAGIDRALTAMGNFADLISPHLAGHSVGVAELTGAAARRCGIEDAGVAAARRAACVHDLGRVAVHARIWEKRGALTPDEWEQVLLHPYQTERVLSRSAFLSTVARVAGAHHERLDGSGYHRGSAAPELPRAARLLAAADAYHAMTEPRPHRAALVAGRVVDELAREVARERLDADAVSEVLAAAGQRVPRLERPAGLTEREAEVIGLLARGLHTKQVARALGISVKTADRHIQNAYRKIGVSTRAAATLFAMEHGLVAWGELPMSRLAARP